MTLPSFLAWLPDYDTALKYGFAGGAALLTLVTIVMAQLNRSRQSFLLLVFLLGWLPFFVSFRYPPNPVFPSELVALTLMALLGLAATLLPTDRRHEQPALPWAMLLWLGLVAALAIQSAVLPVYYWSDRLVPALYALTAALGVWSLSRARQHFGIDGLATALAWGLLCGAVMNSIIAAGQVQAMLQDGQFRLIFGNIGQKNMYGHLIAWGLASALWLTARRELPRLLCGVLAVWLALAMAWSSSRSPLMYAGAWFIIGSVLALLGYYAGHASATVKRFGILLAIAAVLIIVMQFVAPWVNEGVKLLLGIAQDHSVPTALDRLDSNGARRFVEWSKAWEAFLAHPLAGIGWGAFPQQSVALQVRPEFALVQESVLFTHAHNSFLNLLAEMGLLGTLPVLVCLLAVAWGLVRHWRNPVTVFGLSLAVVSLLHSGVEYPLWYFHFLGPFAVALYLLNPDGPRALQLPAWTQQAGIAALTLPLLVLCALAGVLYCRMYPVMDASNDTQVNMANMKQLEQLGAIPLTDYYAEHALSNYIQPSTTQMEWKLAILRRSTAVRPYPADLAHRAIMETLAGNRDIARTLMRQAAFAFPENIDYLYEITGAFPQPEVRALKTEIDDAMRLLRPDKPIPELAPPPAPAAAASQ
ncbi:PglL family O-oligosaccharyltransferase [Chitinilyticum litopenaei]|uniref:PglL family O-oligosaccharyltransferase n=1 Tax=Chitinilyticum litopenaei TaxID=1121276 RepID=UPI00041CA24A|nr:O-antigen ligase family protein [Chitinilyticum litopenaei]